jgi:hypothetical protein
MRPLLLLDVDGVLNIYGAPVPPPGFTDHDLFPEDDEPVRLNLGHGAWLTEMLAVADIAWATGWNAEANRLLAPLLGLPALPVVTMPDGHFDPDDKISRIDAYAGDRPAAWIDDLHTEASRKWAAARAAPTLLITTDPATGLTRGAVDRVVGWAAAQRTK